MDISMLEGQDLEDFLEGYLVAWKEFGEGILRVEYAETMGHYQEKGYRYFWEKEHG